MLCGKGRRGSGTGTGSGAHGVRGLACKSAGWALLNICIPLLIAAGCAANEVATAREAASPSERAEFEACAKEAGLDEAPRDTEQFFVRTGEATAATKKQAQQEAKLDAIGTLVESVRVDVFIGNTIETTARQRISGGVSVEEVQKLTERVIRSYSGGFVTDAVEMKRCALMLPNGDFRAVSQIRVPLANKEAIEAGIRSWPSQIYPARVRELSTVFSTAQDNLIAGEIMLALQNFYKASALSAEAEALEYLIDAKDIRKRPTLREIRDWEARAVNMLRDLRVLKYRKRLVAGQSAEVEVLASSGDKHAPVSGLPIVFDIERQVVGQKKTGPSGAVTLTDPIGREGTVRLHASPDISELRGEVSREALATLAKKDVFTPPIEVQPRGSRWPWVTTALLAATAAYYGWQEGEAVQASNDRQAGLLAQLNGGGSLTPAEYDAIMAEMAAEAQYAQDHRQKSDLAFGTAAILVGVAIWLYPYEPEEEPPTVLPAVSANGRDLRVGIAMRW